MPEQKQLTLPTEQTDNMALPTADKNSDKNYPNPLWLSISESAKFGGITSKTIRRAIQSKQIKFKIIKNRYLVNLDYVLQYLTGKKKLQNKLNQYGLGQYVEKWK
jgi:hypothetical protein